ncbi:hypothetical protein DERP_007981 [Dermatophagoides pteronyssinus]|uniref:Uncharacterized protein n=1 Tax=Dermatophagoides pteronyssinus TaxID=6956 RepID=A0ABQ8IT87_DERPT|nr:hypothetical protein DERP_007981 [Dermatophagoides pteronyssinus]
MFFLIIFFGYHRILVNHNCETCNELNEDDDDNLNGSLSSYLTQADLYPNSTKRSLKRMNEWQNTTIRKDCQFKGHCNQLKIF